MTSRPPVIHTLLVAPNGETWHWAVDLPRAEAVALLTTEAERLFPGHRCELHTRRAFGRLWLIMFIGPSRPAPTAQPQPTPPDRTPPTGRGRRTP